MPRLTKLALHKAARAQKLDRVQQLVESGQYLVNARDDSGKTPLHWVAKWGKLPVLQLLLRLGADVNATDECGWTPLHEACYYCPRQDLIVALVSNGANIHLKTSADSPVMDSKSPLEILTELAQQEEGKVHRPSSSQRSPPTGTPLRFRPLIDVMRRLYDERQHGRASPSVKRPHSQIEPPITDTPPSDSQPSSSTPETTKPAYLMTSDDELASPPRKRRKISSKQSDSPAENTPQEISSSTTAWPTPPPPLPMPFSNADNVYSETATTAAATETTVDNADNQATALRSSVNSFSTSTGGFAEPFPPLAKSSSTLSSSSFYATYAQRVNKAEEMHGYEPSLDTQPEQLLAYFTDSISSTPVTTNTTNIAHVSGSDADSEDNAEHNTPTSQQSTQRAAATGDSSDDNSEDVVFVGETRATNSATSGAEPSEDEEEEILELASDSEESGVYSVGDADVTKNTHEAQSPGFRRELLADQREDEASEEPAEDDEDSSL